MASLQLVIILYLSCLYQATKLPNLAGDVLLTRLESPYDAVGDTLIPHDSTVTIESGTVLRFPRGAQLTVRGRLIAKVNSCGFVLNFIVYSSIFQRVHPIDELYLQVQLVHFIIINNKLIQLQVQIFDFVLLMVLMFKMVFYKCISKIDGVMFVQNFFGKYSSFFSTAYHIILDCFSKMV